MFPAVAAGLDQAPQVGGRKQGVLGQLDGERFRPGIFGDAAVLAGDRDPPDFLADLAAGLFGHPEPEAGTVLGLP